MKLLFDEQLSPWLAHRLADVFPGSAHVHDLGLGSCEDRAVWQHARDQGYAIVTKDADFIDLAVTQGAPPQVVWLRLGNCTTLVVETFLRAHTEAVRELSNQEEASILTLTGS